MAKLVLAMFTSIDEMVDLTNIGTLFAFVLVCIGILVLRKRDPDRPRAFKTPWVPLVPILGMVVNLALMYSLGRSNWIRLFVWLIIGQVIYFAYSRRHSYLRRESAASVKSL